MAQELSNQDTQLYDRQIRLWGHSKQQQLLQSKVLILGLTSSNIETAKNLVLSGVSVMLCSGIQRETHLSDYKREQTKIHEPFNFLWTERDCAEGVSMCATRLQELNDSVVVDSMAEIDLSTTDKDCGDATISLFKSFNALVVSIDCCTHEELIKLNMLCRKNCQGFFVLVNCGLYNGAFIDFGRKGYVNCFKSNVVVSFPSISEFLQVSPTTLPSGYKQRLRKIFKKPHDSVLSFFLLLKKRYSEKTPWWEKLCAVCQQYGCKQHPHVPIPICSNQNISSSESQSLQTHFSIPEEMRSTTLEKELLVWLSSWGFSFPASAAVLGGLVSQEIQKFLTNMMSNPKNLIVFNGRTCEGLTLNINVVESAVE